MKNFLEETIGKLNVYGKNPADVLWVGLAETAFFEGMHISFDEFAILANFEYNNKGGAPTIPIDLMVVGDGWWLERAEYDGSEWWVFRSVPTRPKKMDIVAPKTPDSERFCEFFEPRQKKRFN